MEGVSSILGGGASIVGGLIIEGASTFYRYGYGGAYE